MSFHLAWYLDEAMEESKFLGLPCPPYTADRSHQDTPGHIPVLYSWCLAGPGLWIEVNMAWVILEEREVLWVGGSIWMSWQKLCLPQDTKLCHYPWTPLPQRQREFLTSPAWWLCHISLLNVSWWFSLSQTAPDCDFGLWTGQGHLWCGRCLGMQLKSCDQVRTPGMPQVDVLRFTVWTSGLFFSSVSGWAVPRVFFES